MNKKELENKIKKYINEHKEMQEKIVSVKAMDNCAKNCQCNLYCVMHYLRFGRL